MTVGRLYYYTAAIFLCALMYVSHIKLEWPEKGYKPHSSMGNVWMQGKEKKGDGARRSERREQRERSRSRNPRRRSDDGERRARRRD